MRYLGQRSLFYLNLVVKTADGLRHATFFKGKLYAIIFDDLDWKNKNILCFLLLDIQVLCQKTNFIAPLWQRAAF